MKFTDINLIDQLQSALVKQGYEEPTPIQEKAIPPILEGKDLMGIAQTGTGKTAAFALPLLQELSASRNVPSRGSPRALILAPTRELAAQIHDSIKAYGKNLHMTSTVIFGGVGQNPQVKALNRGIDVLVATPGRLLDLMQQGHVTLDKVEVFVLDEADRMLDMGFIHDVKRIAAKLPKQRHTLFFSATMSAEISKLAASMLTDPVRVEVAPQATTVEKIDQYVLFVDQNNKDDLLLKLLEQEHLDRVLVFTRTKHRANKVVKTLMRNKVGAAAIHGNKSQTARTQALKAFKTGDVRVLVATDIAARGIDVESISHVINYDLPNEAESYVHRIGRTARAGAEGTAYSFCAAQERDDLRAIEKLIRMEVPVMDHGFHSETAKNATGSAARAPKKQPFNRKPRGPPRGKPRKGGSKGRAPKRR